MLSIKSPEQFFEPDPTDGFFPLLTLENLLEDVSRRVAHFSRNVFLF